MKEERSYYTKLYVTDRDDPVAVTRRMTFQENDKLGFDEIDTMIDVQSVSEDRGEVVLDCTFEEFADLYLLELGPVLLR